MNAGNLEPKREGRRWLVPYESEYVPLTDLPTDARREWRQFLAARRQPCPSCSSRDVLYVEWGLPPSDYFEQPHPPHVEAGCVLPSELVPNRQCQTCGSMWEQHGKKPALILHPIAETVDVRENDMERGG